MENIEHDLWTESFRPSTLDGNIGNEALIEKAKIWIANNELPHLLFYGSAGTGKTTLAKILSNAVDSQTMYINASTGRHGNVILDIM